MNVPKQILVALFLTVIIIGCRRNEVSHPDALPEQLTATLTGRVFDANSTPLSNATVKLGSRTSATDDSGYFRFDNAVLKRKNTVITVEKQDFFKAIKTFNASQGENNVEIRLLYKNLIGSFESVNGGTVSLSNGSKIEIPADGVNKASGGTYTGTVKVYAEYIDPASKNLSSLMPGSMLGNDKLGRKIIVSPLGILSVVLESADGKLLKLAKGKKATLTTLISQSLQASAPATVSMGYLDEETGLWQEEGTATKQGNVYVGAVSHFSYWVGGYFNPAINFSVRYVNPAGGAMINYEAAAYYTNGITAGWGYTDFNGEIDGYLPANTPITLVLKGHYPCYTPYHTVSLPASATNISLGTIVVNPPTSKTLKGRLLDCNGNAVTTGIVLVWDGNSSWPLGTPVNQVGEFSILMSPCSSSLSDCKILCIDSVGNRQTTLMTISLNQPVTDAGNITVCGLAAEQFVKYRKDYGQWEPIINCNNDWPGNGIYIQGGSNSNMAQIRGVTAWGLIGVDFEFTHNNTTGVYPITRLLEMEYSPPYELIPPFNVTLTKFPLQAGDFYEGSFQGNCRHRSTGNQIHFFECNFRVRKMNL